jgi:TP901 family phage tail tape measure protein
MSGIANWQAQIRIDIEDLKKRIKVAEGEINNFTNEDRKVKLDIDTKTLESAIQKLDKMLDSLGKGTGDFKQFENLSKELSSIVLEVQSLSKAFGKVDDSGAKTLLSSIQNIDKSLSELSQNILNVNKNISNMGGNTSGAVKQVENISNAYQDAAKEAEKLADVQSKIGQKTNISLGDSKEQSTEIDLYHNLEKRKVTYDEIIDKIQTIVSLKEKEKSLSKTSDDTKLYQNLYDENDINWAGDTEGTINRISDRLKEIYTKYNGKISLIDENDIQEATYLLDILKGSGESPNLNKSQEKFYQNKKFSNDSLFDNIRVDSQKAEEIDKINTELSETYRWFNQLEGVSLNENIANEIKSLISDMQIGGKTASEYANDLLKIFNIEVGSNSTVEQQNKLQSELKETESQAEKTAQAVNESSSTTPKKDLKDAFPDKDVSASVEAATNSIKEENNVLEQNTQKVKENTQAKEQNTNVNFNKYDKRLDSYNGKIDKYKTTINRFNDGGWTSSTYLENVQAVKNAVKEYEDLLKELKGKDASLVTSEDINKLDDYEKKIKDTIATVTNMSASEKGYNFVSAQKELDKIHKLLNENSNMSAEAKAKIKSYYAEIESGNPSMSLDRIHGEIMKIYNAEVEAGRAGKSFFDTLKNSGFHQLAAQMAGMFGVYDVINLGKQAFSTVKELDYALVDLKKTTAMNSSELEQFYYDSNDVAKQMGVTTKEIIDQASSWSRLGYNSKQAATEMAKLSSQFALISPGMDTTTSQEGLVSIMKAWDIGYQDVKSQIMDDINALGNAMAEDNQDIVEGMERSAAALAAVGTSTKDAFALFSGIQEVLQNSEKSGTSLRSVALRLRSFDETTGEYSEDLANITGELADLTKTAEHAQGVSVFKPGSTTEFKSLVDYFREIADIWDEMSQKQQNDFLLKAFGRTQAQAGAALIQNFKGVEKALDVMDNAAGSSDKEMETAKQSITYKLNELKQTWVGTVQDIANRKDLSLIMSGLIGVSKGLGFVIGKLGLIPSVIAPIAAILGKGKSTQRFCPVW